MFNIACVQARKEHFSSALLWSRSHFPPVFLCLITIKLEDPDWDWTWSMQKKKVCQEFVSVDWITCCIQSNLFFLLEIIPPVWSVAWSIALYSVGVENQECSIDEEIRFANMPACLSETWNVQNEWRTNCLPETQTLASLADWTLPVSLKHKLWQAWLIGLWLVRKEFLQNCGFPTVSHQNLFGIA